MSESLQIWLSGAGVSEETERVGSGPKGNGAGIDPTAVALAMAGASRERANALLKDQQELIAPQLHHLIVTPSHLALAKFGKPKNMRPTGAGCARTSREVHMLNIIAIAAVISGLLTFPIAAYADAKSQIATAAQHAGLAAAAPNLPQAHMHLHHALNCLVGPQDADFDKNNTNPCAQQGKGAFPDESDPEIKTKLQSAMSAAADGIASRDEATAKKAAATVETLLNAIK